MKQSKKKKEIEKTKDNVPFRIKVALSHRIENIKFFDILVFIIIILLMVGDFFVLYLTFLSGDSADISLPESVLFSCIFALCLEGTPYVLATAMNSLFFNRFFARKENKRGKTKEFVKTLLTILLSSIFLISLLVFVTDLRQQVIDERGGRKAYIAGTYATRVEKDSYGNEMTIDGDESYLVDSFLKYEPICTSVLAFLFSFVFLQSSALSQARRAMIRAERRTQKIRKYASNLQNEFEIKKHALWNAAGVGVDNVFSKGDFNGPPDNWDDFIGQLQARKLESVLRENYEVFSNLLNRYNTRITTQVFQVLLTRMSLRSTIPETIRAIDIDAVIEEHDKETTTAKEKWNLAGAEEALKSEYWDRLIAHPLIRPKDGHGVGEQNDIFGNKEDDSGTRQENKKQASGEHSTAPKNSPNSMNASGPNQNDPRSTEYMNNQRDPDDETEESHPSVDAYNTSYSDDDSDEIRTDRKHNK